MNNSKILLIGQLPPPHHGSNLMAELFRDVLVDLEYHVEIVEKKFSTKIEDVRKFSIRKVLKIPFLILKLLSLLKKNSFEICFYFLSKEPPSIYIDALLLFIIRQFKVKYVLYQHTKGLYSLNQTILIPSLRIFVNKIISLSSGAMVLCEKLKSDINHLIPNKLLFVLPNAIPDLSNPATKTISIKKDKVNILFLSNLMPEKGTMVFVEMANLIKSINRNVHFFLAGPKMSKTFFKKIIEFIKNNDLNNYFTIIGPVYNIKKEEVFADSDIFVFPTYDEAFGLVNLEAMRAGIPIVTSNEGCIPEVVIDGINGFIVNPKDIHTLTRCVLKLIDDPILRCRMGKAGREIYQNYFRVENYQKNVEKALKFFLK